MPAARAGHKDLRTASFFDCSSVVSAFLVFHQLRRVNTWEEAVASFTEYDYRSNVDRQAPRPLQLLALPRDELTGCRVVNQQAALLFPDVVLPSEYKEGRRQPPPGKA